MTRRRSDAELLRDTSQGDTSTENAALIEAARNAQRLADPDDSARWPVCPDCGENLVGHIEGSRAGPRLSLAIECPGCCMEWGCTAGPPPDVHPDDEEGDHMGQLDADTP